MLIEYCDGKIILISLYSLLALEAFLTLFVLVNLLKVLKEESK